jgi:hypothetical protein
MDLTPEQEKLMVLSAAATIDALRECFVAASLAISVIREAQGIDEFVDLLRRLGVKDGFGLRAMDILSAAGVEPPDVAGIVKQAKQAVDKSKIGH